MKQAGPLMGALLIGFVSLCCGHLEQGVTEPQYQAPHVELSASPTLVPWQPIGRRPGAGLMYFRGLVRGDILLRNAGAWSCPEQTWEWGDGSKSVVWSQCVGIDPSTRFEAKHRYDQPGIYTVRLTLRVVNGVRLADPQVAVEIAQPGTMP